MSFPSLFAILFAGGALRRRRALPRWLPALVFILLGLLGSSMAQATNFIFDGRNIGGCTLTNKEYSCPSASAVNGNDEIIIVSGYTLRINNSLGFGWNQGLSMQSGAKLVLTGHFSIADMNPDKLAVSGGSIEVGGTFYMGSSAQSMTADVKAGGIQLGNARVTINGSLTSSGVVNISSGSKITGDISGTVITTNSPTTIIGNVNASSKFTLASGSTVSGSVTAPVFDMLASNSKVSGDILASTSLTMGSGNTVNGNVDTGELLLQASNGIITGNASVNHATLEWAGRVAGTIACKNGTVKDKCDCVTNNSGYAINTASGPRCTGPAPSAGIHHFLLTHDGEGDTCLPEKITLTACANAACTAPHYPGTASGTLTPFGDSFTIAEGAGAVAVNVKRYAEGAVTLDVSSASVGTQSPATCYRTGNNTNSCDMSFAGGAKLLLEAPDHKAGADGITVPLQAVKANDAKTACVAAFENVEYPVQYSCSYSKPASGTLPLALDGQSLACAAGTKMSINTSFGAEGRASQPVKLKYADAGEVRLNALIDTGKGMTASGQDSFTTVPASFGIGYPAGTIRAGAEFALTIKALNVAGAVTPNFDNNDLNNALAIKHGVTLAVACHRQGGSTGTVTPAAPAFTDGVASVNATWSDVGNIDLNASLADFLGITGLNAAGSTNTAGAGNCSGALGPFIPAYYRLALADARSWYYSGEPLPLLVSAMNKAGALTVNYQATLSEAVTLSANDKTGAAFAPAPGALSITTLASTAFVNGVASVKPSYAFTAWPGAPTQIRLRASNGKAAGLDVSSAAVAAAEGAMPVIRTGRLRLGSRFGGLKTTLSVPVTAEYWTGRSWLLNSDDSHTLIPESSFGIKPTVSGMTVSKNFAASPLKLAGGAASFDLRVTAGGPGPVDIAVNLGNTLMDNACINDVAGSGLALQAAGIPWLRPFITGCSTSLFRDPSGRATFGVYTPEDRRLIHVREVFN